MTTKTVLLFCAQVFLVQITTIKSAEAMGPDTLALDDSQSWGALTKSKLEYICLEDVGITLALKYISANCLGTAYNGIANGLAYGPAPFAGIRNGLPYTEAPIGCAADFTPAASYGGGFQVRSVSPIAPTGVFMTSENVYEGPISVSGTVPFLAAVALEGTVPTAGTGTINYGCGTGEVAMLSEGVSGYTAGPYGYGVGTEGYAYGPLGYGAGIAAPGYGYGYNRGRGCGAVY